MPGAYRLEDDSGDIGLNDLTDYYELAEVPEVVGVSHRIATGDGRAPAILRGWWDGAVEQPVTLKGWRDVSTVEPIIGGAP